MEESVKGLQQEVKALNEREVSLIKTLDNIRFDLRKYEIDLEVTRTELKLKGDMLKSYVEPTVKEATTTSSY